MQPPAVRVLSLAFLVFAFTPLTTAAAQSDTLWRHVAPTKIRFLRVDPAGHVLLPTDQEVVALDPDSGTVVWRYPTTARPSVLRATPLGLLLVGHGRQMSALDPVRGDTVWHRTDLPALDRTSFALGREESFAVLQTARGFALLNVETGTTMWDSTALPPGIQVREYFRLSDHNLMLLLARAPRSDVAMLAVTLDSGRVLWQIDSLFRKKPKFEDERGVEYLRNYHVPRVLEDSTLLLYFSEDGPVRLDPVTGTVLWRGDELAGKNVPATDRGYPAARLLDSLVLMPSEKTLVALDVATGRIRWRSPQFRDQPTWLVPRREGILVGGIGRDDPFLTLLDPATGAGKWARELKFKLRARAYLLRDTVYVTDDKSFLGVPWASGAPATLAALPFEGGELPARIDTVEGGGLVLYGTQNLMRVGLDGKVAYHRYYKAPGATLLSKLAGVITSNPVLLARHAQATM
ncbi:MAG: PQQ-like beta-propeller repeat protein, partial [Gemmatimonadota bacterium]|nr:PQQ-like beta-propeller repeat protein [Gemmatimonadota bacterium]